MVTHAYIEIVKCINSTCARKETTFLKVGLANIQEFALYYHT